MIPAEKATHIASVLFPYGACERRFIGFCANALVQRKTRLDTLLLVYARFSRPHTNAEKQRVENWLRRCIKGQRVKLIVE